MDKVSPIILVLQFDLYFPPSVSFAPKNFHNLFSYLFATPYILNLIIQCASRMYHSLTLKIYEELFNSIGPTRADRYLR